MSPTSSSGMGGRLRSYPPRLSSPPAVEATPTPHSLLHPLGTTRGLRRPRAHYARFERWDSEICCRRHLDSAMRRLRQHLDSAMRRLGLGW
eukprot:525481-Rhodomonas_salina.2